VTFQDPKKLKIFFCVAVIIIDVFKEIFYTILCNRKPPTSLSFTLNINDFDEFYIDFKHLPMIKVINSTEEDSSDNRERKATFFGRIYDKFFPMPDNKPNFFIAGFYGISGAALTWGSHIGHDIEDADRYKDLINAELTNVGILAALILTIAVNPVQNSPPDNLTNQALIDVYYALWTLSSIVLSFSVLIAVIGLTHLQAYKDAEELNRLRHGMGILIHAPLHLLVIGGIFSLLGILETLWVQVDLGVFVFICAVALVVFLLTTFIFVRFVQTAWDAFHPKGPVQQQSIKRASKSLKQQSVSGNNHESDRID
jgi:hypothetical protein